MPQLNRGRLVWQAERRVERAAPQPSDEDRKREAADDEQGAEAERLVTVADLAHIAGAARGDAALLSQALLASWPEAERALFDAEVLPSMLRCLAAARCRLS